MKKTSKFIISVFILLFTIVGGFYYSNYKVEALYAPAEGTISVYNYTVPKKNQYERNIVNKITVSEKGKIEITYSHGFAEVMIFVYSCSKYASSANACETFVSKPEIIHVGGDYNDEKDENGNQKLTATKTIHLFNYFNYEEILKLEFIASFINVEKTASTSSTQYKYLYYDVDSVECGESDEKCVVRRGTDNRNREPKQHVSVYSRIYRYICGVSDPWNVSESVKKDYNDCSAANMKYITLIGNRIYKGDVASREVIPSNKIGGTNGTVYVKVDNSKVEGGAGDVEALIYDTLIPTLITILLIAAGISIAVLGYKIVKSSDEPQERQESVKKLRNILIGIALALIVLFALKPLIKLVQDYIGE